MALHALGVGGNLLLQVDDLVDSAPDPSACLPDLLPSGACNYRSAVRRCQEYLDDPLKFCTVHLPALETLTLDPLLGDVALSEARGNFILVRSSEGIDEKNC
jgi:hypothetical protein